MTIPAQATVERLDYFSTNPLWEVTVISIPPHEHRRVYQLRAKSDNMAAWEGLRLFGDEMEALVEQAGE